MKLLVQIKKQLEHMVLDVDFSVEKEAMALLGASGAGKSMTLKCIAGIETPDEGRIILDDIVLFDSKEGINLPARKRRVGYLFQEYALFPNMTVEQNISIVCGKCKKTEQLLKRYFIDDIRGKYPAEISGGQKQRVALARMMAAEPKVILLDEPFSALDVQSRNEVVRSTEKLIADSGAITVLVTHHYEEVSRLAKRVACLKQGKMEAVHGVREFFEKPETVTAFRLLGGKNVSRCVACLEGKQLRACDWGIVLPNNAECSHIGIDEKAFHLLPCHNSIPVPVNRMELGEDVFHWYIYIYPQEQSKKPICCQFLKSEMDRGSIGCPGKIYMEADKIYYLTD